MNNQKLEIFEFSKKNKLEVDDFIQMTISSKKTTKQRRIDEMVAALNDFDKDIEKIKELLSYGLSGRKIATVLGYTSHITLNTYINKRGLRKDVKTGG